MCLDSEAKFCMLRVCLSSSSLSSPSRQAEALKVDMTGR